MKVLILGPPAVGKTTVASLVTGSAHRGIAHIAVDKTVQQLAVARNATVPLSDQLIDDAVVLFLNTLPRDGTWLVELTHHDYTSLLLHRILLLEQFASVAILTANYDVLERRNRCRNNVVPQAYVKRCFASTVSFLEMVHSVRDPKVFVFDTSADPANIVAGALFGECLVQHYGE